MDVGAEWYRVYVGPVIVVDAEYSNHIESRCGFFDNDFRMVKKGEQIVLIPNSMELRQFGDIFSCYGSDNDFIKSPNCARSIVEFIRAVASSYLTKLTADAVEYDVIWACVDFDERL